MFQLTRKTDYGLRLMVEVAAAEGPLATADAARRQRIPYEFLRKVAASLVSAGLLVGERGSRGGLSLARPAETLTVLDVVQALEPTSLNRCTVDPSACERRDICACYPVWVEAQTEMERVLSRTTLADVALAQAGIDKSRKQRRANPNPRGGRAPRRSRPQERSAA